MRAKTLNLTQLHLIAQKIRDKQGTRPSEPMHALALKRQQRPPGPVLIGRSHTSPNHHNALFTGAILQKPGSASGSRKKPAPIVGIKGRDHHQGEQCGGDEPTEHNDGEGLKDFIAGAIGKG